MSTEVDLACTVCAEEFSVPIEVYRAYSGIVPCPCCESTDLVLLAERHVASGSTALPRDDAPDTRIWCSPSRGSDMNHGNQRAVIKAGKPRLKLEEVLETERPAWAASEVGGPCISFDGIEFWVGADHRPLRVAQKSEIPSSGWWHKDSCNCRVCRSARDSEAQPSGTRESGICA